jgi:hypothetical protein
MQPGLSGNPFCRMTAKSLQRKTRFPPSAGTGPHFYFLPVICPLFTPDSQMVFEILQWTFQAFGDIVTPSGLKLGGLQ